MHDCLCSPGAVEAESEGGIHPGNPSAWLVLLRGEGRLRGLPQTAGTSVTALAPRFLPESP